MSSLKLWVVVALLGFAGGATPATEPSEATTRSGAKAPYKQTNLTIAFVCDSRSSMAPVFGSLKIELGKAVKGLHPHQMFSITFMKEKKPTYVDRQLIEATPENKQRALAFLDASVAKGSPDPIPALDLALGQHPQLIYLLTNGDFPDDSKLLSEIQKVDPDHLIKINAIAFVVGKGDQDQKFIRLLTQIATDSGGVFKKVNAADLDESPAPTTAPATQP